MKSASLAVLLACFLMVLGSLTGTAEGASAKPKELVLTTWSAPTVTGVRSFIPLAKEIEEKTGGRYRVRVAWGGSLGKTAEHYDLVLRGMADIAMFVPAFTPGRFPMMEIMGLPVQVQTAEIATEAIQHLHKKGYFDKDLSDVKLLYLWSTPPYHILWGKGPVSSLADIKGKKVRSGGGEMTATLKSIGAVPVGISPTELYGAMTKGTVDGTFSGYTTIVAWKLIEAVKSVTELGVGSLSFGVIMNKKVWGELPKDVQAIFESLYDKYAAMHCAEFVEDEVKGKDGLAKLGAAIMVLSDADRAQFKRLVKSVIENWAAENGRKGLPVKQALDDLHAVLKGLGVQEPFEQ